MGAPGIFTVTTPEQVTVPFEIAPIGVRVGAFLLDLLVISLGLGLLAIIFGIASIGNESGFLAAFVLLAVFLGRNFYFVLSEVSQRGQTFGKKRTGIRVVARDGGPLTAEMIFARNLTREIEFFVPLTVLFAPRLLFGDEPGWAVFIGVVWLIVIVLLPFFNKHRARVGDLVAGTLVVVAPTGRLLDDLARDKSPESRRPEYGFTAEQLDVYGIHELQVLEDVLRHDMPDPALIDEIADKIKRKIHWSKKRWDVPSEPFLRSFYKAQRARLEHKMLLGKRQERKVR